MKIIISPAKTVREGTGAYCSLPIETGKTQAIVDCVKHMDMEELMHMWGCSEAIAQMNLKRFETMDLHENLMSAIERYTGMQYKNLDYGSLSEEGKAYLNDHLRILSSFYGLLKPDDGIVTYRMDYNAKIEVNDTGSLYAYWGSIPYDLIDDSVIVNLASDEYAKSVLPYIKEEDTMITIRFLQNRNGKLRSASTLAKQARGKFVRFMAENGIEDVNELKQFNDNGFVFDEELSDESAFIFIR